MSRDEAIEQMTKIIDETTGFAEEEMPWEDYCGKIAERIYDAGFRDITELRKWLEGIKIHGYTDNTLMQIAYCEGWKQLKQEILDKLESEG